MISTKNTSADPVKAFYSKYFCFSYSSLNKLIHSAPSFFNWYILKEREDKLFAHFLEGKAVHCLLLERKMFDKQFIVMPGSIPGASNKRLTEYIYKLWKEREDVPTKKYSDYESDMLQWLIDDNLHQGLKDDKDLTKADAKTGDQKRAGKVLDTKSNDYFEYLKKSENKDVIDVETYDKCMEAVEALRENAAVKDLLKEDGGFELLEVHNEKTLEVSLQGYPFGLKGIVDNYVIDHAAKKVYINDLKTSGKTLSDFKDSVKYYKYSLQAAIYVRMVKGCHPDTSDYEYVFHFIVIDKYNQVYPFPVSVESMLDWQSQLDEVLNIANYHYTKKEYKLPYEFAQGQVTL